jgi:hypothetical protein
VNGLGNIVHGADDYLVVGTDSGHLRHGGDSDARYAHSRNLVGCRPVAYGRPSRTAPEQRADSASARNHGIDAHVPWPDEIGTGVFGQRGRVAITKVRPELVLEVAVDPALQGGRYRHALRYLRLRADMDPTDVEAPA